MLATRPAMAHLLPGLLALLLLHWSAASLPPRGLGSVGERPPGVDVAETVQPAILAAVARTVAARLGTVEKSRPSDAGRDAATVFARADFLLPRGYAPAGSAGDPGGVSLPVRAFDARAPPLPVPG
jgi:hypothetical protein